MKTRAIVQINPETGQKNVTLTTDSITSLEDFLAPWPNSEVHVGEVLILSADDGNIVDYILDTELRSVDNDMLTPEEVAVIGGGSNLCLDRLVHSYPGTLTDNPATAWERIAKRLIDSFDDRTQE